MGSRFWTMLVCGLCKLNQMGLLCQLLPLRWRHRTPPSWTQFRIEKNVHMVDCATCASRAVAKVFVNMVESAGIANHVMAAVFVNIAASGTNANRVVAKVFVSTVDYAGLASSVVAKVFVSTVDIAAN